MNKIILCPKSSGNTFEVCSYISRNLGCTLMIVNENRKLYLDDYDVIILASGVYANNAHKNILKWIKNSNISGNKIGNIYLFLTWIGRGDSDVSAYNSVKRRLNNRGITLQNDYFKCYGKGMGLLRKNHPNEDDKINALKWVSGLK